MMDAVDKTGLAPPALSLSVEVVVVVPAAAVVVVVVVLLLVVALEALVASCFCLFHCLIYRRVTVKAALKPVFDRRWYADQKRWNYRDGIHKAAC